MLYVSDHTRYLKLVEDLNTNFIKWKINYPSVVMEAYNLLLNYQYYHGNQHGYRLVDYSEEVSFTNIKGNDNGG